MRRHLDPYPAYVRRKSVLCTFVPEARRPALHTGPSLAKTSSMARTLRLSLALE